MNTGNNLLFFGWGMVLSAIVVSGVLSEATLRVLEGRLASPAQARAFEPAHLPITVVNLSRRVPAYALELVAEVRGPKGFAAAPAPYQLRLAPGTHSALLAQFTPTSRGRFTVAQLQVRTAYPFGFFEKSRRLPMAAELHFWCFPQAVDVTPLMHAVRARLGEAPLPQAGSGDDFFSLRPYRSGDDIRRVAWRRSARAGRWVVIETEAVSGHEVLLEMQPQPGADAAAVEHAIATLGSLAEALLTRAYRVGVRAPGVLLPPDGGGRQRWEILTALAKLQPEQGVPAAPPSARIARLTLVGPGLMTPAGAAGRDAVVLPVTPPVGARSVA